MRKEILITSLLACAISASAVLPVKETLPNTLLAPTTIVAESNAPKRLQIDGFEYSDSFSMDLRCKVNTPYNETGLEIEAINTNGDGFRFSLNSAQLSRSLSSPVTRISIKDYLDNSNYANYRFAKKTDSVHVYRNGVHMGTFATTKIGNAVFDGCFQEPLGNSSNSYDYSLNSNVWFGDAAGFNARPSIRLIKSPSQVSTAANSQNSAIYLPFNDNSYAGTYLSTPVGLEAQKDYTLTFNLLSWGGNGLGKKLKMCLASEKNGTGIVVGETVFTSSTANTTPFAFVKCSKTFTAADLEKLGGCAYLVVKRVDTNAQLAITNIELLPDSYQAGLIIGKRHAGGVASKFDIEQITFDGSDAFSPRITTDLSDTWLENPAKTYYIHKCTDIGLVESSFPVGYDFVDMENYQYIAYYDKNKNMTIAQLQKQTGKWQYTILNSKIGWDSHNYVTLAIDKEGYIHVSGNMHKVQVQYWRSKQPHNISEMNAIHYMVGSEENSTTYPEFLKTADGDLLFHYRQGQSGSGYEVYNIWHPETKSWKRFLDKPLIDGKGLRNAYMQGPVKGPDGYYHLLWMWRESANCETNHTLSYARSRDLKQWESIRGERINGSITIDDICLVVDPTPVKMGLINTTFQIGFDSQQRPILSYVKYDYLGNTQLYAARYNQQDGKWGIKALTKWEHRWNFSGMGSIRMDVTNETPYITPNGLAFGYNHIKYGVAEVVVNESSLEPVGLQKKAKTYPDELDSVRMQWAKPIHVQKRVQRNQYILRWETQAPNNDIRPPLPLPDATMLQLYEYYDYPSSSSITKPHTGQCKFRVSTENNSIHINKLSQKQKIGLYHLSGELFFEQEYAQSEVIINGLQIGGYIIKVDDEAQKIIIQ